MCGICGFYSSREKVNMEKFHYMTDIVQHRGPDDKGIYVKENIALGHRRLAIIDLEREGHQPFIYHDNYIMVYNGEIYNYEELREGLERGGHHFYTKTDTEVLIAMYEKYGEKCVEELNGMWAFCIYDKKEKKLFCSRDRFGIKPFYFYFDGTKFIFASEIKQIIFMLGEQPKANRKKLLEFLVYGDQDYTDETMFEGIKQLRGGENLLFYFERNEIILKQYYDLKKIPTTKLEFAGACQEFCKLFQESVKLRLKADVPVGYCLSGGLDSSAIVCMANDLMNHFSSSTKQIAVSSCFHDKRYDEREYIDHVINRTGIISKKIFPKKENLFDKIDKIIWHMDEPFGSTSIYAQWKVFEFAKQNGLTVMLDGQGADEQLAGYSSFYSVLFAYYLRKLKWLKCWNEIKKYKQNRANTEEYISAGNIVKSAVLSAYLPENVKNGIRHYIRRKEGLPFPLVILDEVRRRKTIYPIRDEKQYILDSLKMGMMALLHYEDRNSMAHSIEARVPFLDYRVVEALYSYPITYKINNGITKAVMREGLKNYLPEQIQTRYSKLGFVTPEEQWANNDFQLYQKEIERACENLKDILDRDMILKWFDKNNGMWKRGDFLLWRIICASHWTEVFEVKL